MCVCNDINVCIINVCNNDIMILMIILLLLVLQYY